MPLFSEAEIAAIKAGDLSGVLSEQIHYRDAQGNTVLHLLLDHPAQLDQALDKGACPFVYNRAFKTPIDLAVEAKVGLSQ